MISLHVHDLMCILPQACYGHYLLHISFSSSARTPFRDPPSLAIIAIIAFAQLVCRLHAVCAAMFNAGGLYVDFKHSVYCKTARRCLLPRLEHWSDHPSECHISYFYGKRSPASAGAEPRTRGLNNGTANGNSCAPA